MSKLEEQLRARIRKVKAKKIHENFLRQNFTKDLISQQFKIKEEYGDPPKLGRDLQDSKPVDYRRLFVVSKSHKATYAGRAERRSKIVAFYRSKLSSEPDLEIISKPVQTIENIGRMSRDENLAWLARNSITSGSIDLTNIEIPVRTEKCTHLQVFCLNKHAKCPICSKEGPLILDERLYGYLKSDEKAKVISLSDLEMFEEDNLQLDILVTDKNIKERFHFIRIFYYYSSQM